MILFQLQLLIFGIEKLMSIHFEDIRHLCCCKTREIDQQALQEKQTLKHDRHKLYFIKQTTDTLPNNQPRHSPNSPTYTFNYNKEVPPSKKSPLNKNHNLNAPCQQLKILVLKSPNKQHNFKPPPITRIIPQIPLIATPRPVSKPQLIQLRSPAPITGIKRAQVSSAVAPRSPRITITLKNAPIISRMQGKRVRTVEEETEYSSKQSQIQFKNTSTADTWDNFSFSTFQKRDSNNRTSKQVFFQEDQQLLKFTDCKSGSCQEVSPRQQVDHSLSNELLINARTIQTIVTSTEINSRTQSRQLERAFTFFQDSRIAGENLSPINSKERINENRFNEYRFGSPSNHLSQLGRQTNSPQLSRDLSQTPQLSSKMQPSPLSPNINQNLFYADSVSKNPCRSPKISVLEFDQNSEQQELRDVIDHNFLKSQYVSKVNSPIMSKNQSMKNVCEQKQRKPVSFFHFSPEHSRQASQEFTLFKETRKKLQRTNTFESIGSQSSQNSYIDIKFMQRVRDRRGVSRLV